MHVYSVQESEPVSVLKKFIVIEKALKRLNNIPFLPLTTYKPVQSCWPMS